MINPQPDNSPDLSNLLENSDLSDDDIEAVKKAVQDAEALKSNTYDELARDVEGKLNKRMGTRKNKENQWLEALRIFLGSLSSYNVITPDYPFGSTEAFANGTQAGGVIHRPEFNIIRQKCNIAIAQTVAFQFAAGDKNWDIRAPQTIDLDQNDMEQIAQMTGNNQITPEEVQQYKAELMSRQMEDDLAATDYGFECRKSQADWAILGTGVMKGPGNTGKLKKKYIKQQTSTGQIMRIPRLTVENKPLVYRVPLWYFFPDDSVTDIAKAEDAIEVHPMSKQELADLMKHPGYISDQISLCLPEEPRQYTNSPFNDPAYLTQGINLLKNKYLVIEYHGPIKKEDLVILGVDYDENDPMDELYGEIWVVNSRVIRLQLSTLEGCHSLPYHVAVWEHDPATVFGFGIPMLARDQQRVVNESYKMLLDNAGISAGPQVVVDTTIIQPQEGGQEVTPFKVWLAKEYGADMTKAIQFFMPPNAFEGLASLIDKARQFADEESSINLIAAGGNNPSQGLDNATGMALMNENAMTPLFFKAECWDDHITKPLIGALYDWEMQYNPNDAIKGAFTVDVRSSTAYLKEAMERRDLERLSQEIAQGSPIGEWINMDELAQVRLAGMKLPYQGLIKTQQQVAQERASKPPTPPDPNMLKAQAALQANQIAQDSNDIKRQQMQMDMQQHQTSLNAEAQIQHDTNVSNIQERVLDVHRAQIEAAGKQVDAHSGIVQNAQTLNTNLATTAMQEHTKKLQTGVQHAQHLDNLTLEREKIASQERQSHEKADIQLKGIRANAQAKVQNQANRNLTKHNPKPSE